MQANTHVHTNTHLLSLAKEGKNIFKQFKNKLKVHSENLVKRRKNQLIFSIIKTKILKGYKLVKTIRAPAL